MRTLAVIINYKSSDLTLRAARSVLGSESSGPVHLVVLDNSEDGYEAERLRQKLPPAVTLHVSQENIGFGRACTQVFEQYEGERILLINPDARLLPGCLLRLQDTLSSSPDVGAVSPRVFWDEGLRFHLPPSYPPALLPFKNFAFSGGPLAGVSGVVSALWRWHSIRVWRSKRPVRVNNLSGGLVLLKRASVVAAGGLFDPRFFLYFEDTDLFIRMRKAGSTLLIEPRASAIHCYDQCAQREWERKRAFMSRSLLLFQEKHNSGFKSRMNKIMDLLVSAAKGGTARRPLAPDFTAPFVLDVPERLKKRWIFEWSPNSNFIPSAARFGTGPTMEFPLECWAWLAPGQYFGRLGAQFPFGRYSHRLSWQVDRAESREAQQ